MSAADWKSVAIGAAIAVTGALLAFLADAAAGGALGPYGLALAPVIMIALNAFRKWLASRVKPDDPTPVPPGPDTPAVDAEGLFRRLLDTIFGKKKEPRKPDDNSWVAALLAVLLLGGFASAEVKIQGETKVAPYRLVKLTATGDVDGAALVWDLDREDAADVVEVGGMFLFTGPPGTYKVKVRAFRSKDGKLSAETARATITIGDNPNPPTPPGPVPPTPPGPETALVKELRAAYVADVGAEKAKHLASLAAVYREVASKTSSADLKTAGDLLTVLRTAVGSLVPADALTAVRKRIAVEVSASLPSDPAAALDAPTRAKAAEVFTRVASALEVISR